MSANRKLLGEIQQVLKKLEEGVEIFDTIWEKVYAAESQALKEKYEADLKKEIKKLQRLRDQIKTWISSSEIKDKTQLVEARKMIESKMEQFKICEKDTKTKAYSKEGLAREARLDPKEAAREEKRAWINECIERLQDLINTVELEKEKILLNTKNKNKNKELLDKCDNRISKHKWHISRLELIIKLLDHEELDPTLLDGIKDSLEYYIESADDDDGAYGVESEFDIYEDLGLEALGASISFDLPRSKDKDREDDDVKDEKDESQKAASTSATNVITATGKINVPPPSAVATTTTATTKAAQKDGKGAVSASVAKPTAGAKAGKDVKNRDSAEEADSKDSSPTPAVAKDSKGLPKNSPKLPGPSAAAVVAGIASASGQPTASPSSTISTPASTTLGPTASNVAASNSATSVASHASPSMPSASPLAPAIGANLPVVAGSGATAAPAAASSMVSKPEPTSSTTQPNPSATPAVAPTAPAAPAPAAPSASAASASIVQTSDSDDMNSLAHSINSLQMAENMNLRTSSNPPPAISPQLSPELAAIHAQLRSSMAFLDSEADRQSAYQPRNRYNYAHPSFPSQPLFSSSAETQLLFDKLHLDTQFFCFYFQQGTYQQYLASKKLKKSSWRFHKKYATWFQRHTEPKVATDDFEEGTYVYFDYESGWCQRIKSEFKFEYAFLEDEIAL